MATAKTKSDALGLYASDPAGLGGLRADLEILGLHCIVSNPIPPIVIQRAITIAGTGTATIRAASATTLAYTAPGDTEGTPVTVAANTSVLLESGTPARSIRVYRDSVYDANTLAGEMTLELVNQMNHIIAGPDGTQSASDYYACLFLRNHSDQAITSITVDPAALGSARTTATAQLSGSGAGTITVSGSLVGYPDSGWAKILTSGAALREIIYYTSWTGSSLTVPAAGRGLLGTSAAAGASTDTITPIAPLRFWLETPSAGAVQTIADHTTEPTGASWTIAATHASLAAGDEIALWLHRQIPAAATVSVMQRTGINVGYTYNAVTYSHPFRPWFRIGDTTRAGYVLYDGGVQTDESTSLPFDDALAANATHTLHTTRRNKYNLESFNVLAQTFVIDAGGVDVTDTLTNPSDITLTSQPGGEVDLTLTYLGASDATMADTWRLYITTDGTTPDPGTDTPADTAFAYNGFAQYSVTQTITLGPYDYGTVVKVIARVYSSALDDESDSLTVTTETVDTQEPVQTSWGSITTGGTRGHGSPVYEKITYYNDPTNTVGLEVRAGETILFGTSEACRGVYGNDSNFRTGIEFSNVAHSASGTASPIEVIDANTFYINVASTRRAKIDLAAGTIEAASFEFLDTLIALPVIGPTYTTSTETYLMVWSGVTGRWTPFVKVSSTGVFTACMPVLQEIA